MFGTFPVSNEDECSYTQLINNCDNTNIFKKELCYSKYVDLEKIPQYKNICPKPFYKNIIYTLNYKQLEQNKSIIQIIGSPQQFKPPQPQFRPPQIKPPPQIRPPPQNLNPQEPTPQQPWFLRPPSNLEGGDIYYMKYIKYKNKYIRYKNKLLSFD